MTFNDELTSGAVGPSESAGDEISGHEFDPYAPLNPSPKFAHPIAAAGFLCAILSLFTGLAAIVGPIGMAFGLVAHVKGSRYGLIAATSAAVAMIVAFAVSMFLRG